MAKSSTTFSSGFDEIVRSHEPLAPHTWMGIGGPAEYFAEPRSVEELQAVVRRASEEGLPIRVLGGGSNLLVRDDGVPGVTLRLSAPAFGNIQTEKRFVSAGGGARLGHVISSAVRSGLAGLEMLVGIPGTIGGALHGNSGSHGGDIGQWTCQADIMTRTGEILHRNREDLVFAYRQSSLDELVILNAEFQLEEEDPQELTKRMQKQWIVKKAGQPLAHRKRRLHLQKSARHQRRHVDRSGRIERHPGRRRGSERSPCKLHRGRPRSLQPGRAAIDRLWCAAAWPNYSASNWNSKFRFGNRPLASAARPKRNQQASHGWQLPNQCATDRPLSRRRIGRARNQPRQRRTSVSRSTRRRISPCADRSRVARFAFDRLGLVPSLLYRAARRRGRRRPGASRTRNISACHIPAAIRRPRNWR